MTTLVQLIGIVANFCDEHGVDETDGAYFVKDLLEAMDLNISDSMVRELEEIGKRGADEG